MLSDYVDFRWETRHQLTPAMRQVVNKYFSPFRTDGTMYDPDTLSRIIVEWSKVFFGEEEQSLHWHIRLAVPDFHRLIYRDLADEARFYYITCPSEVGKTTIACLVYPLYRAYYQLDPYICIGSATQTLSEEEHLANLKFEIDDNEMLSRVYGEMKPKSRLSRESRTTPWSASEIELSNGVYIRALGMTGRIRGRKRGAQRPTLILMDDPESAEDVESDKILKTNRRWLFRDTVYRLDKDYGKIRLIGNMLSEACLMATVKRDPAWKGVDYSLIDDEGKSIWEEKFPTSVLRREQEMATKAGRFEEFMYERMNKPVKSLTRKLEGYHVVTYLRQRRYGQNLLFLNDDMQHPVNVNYFLGIDPEVDAEDVGARAFITIARGWHRINDVLTDCLFVVDYLWKPLDISNVLDEVKLHHEKYSYTGVTIEINSVQRIFKGYIEKYMAADQFFQKQPFRFFPIKNYGASKISRILRLQPKFSIGHVFIASHMTALMQEARDFGTFKNEGLHLLDALEMADRNAYPPSEHAIREYNPHDLHPDFYASTAPKYDAMNWRLIPNIKV